MKKQFFFIFIALQLAVVSIYAQQVRIQKATNQLYGLAVPKSSGNIKWVVKPIYKKLIAVIDNNNLYYAQHPDNGLWGAIRGNGEEVISFTHDFIVLDNLVSGNFLDYVKNYVETKIGQWQKKGEFEKTSAYKQRVNPSTREAKVAQFTAEAKEKCLKIVRLIGIDVELGDYDPDNETYLVKTTMGNIVVPVPIRIAPKFKAEFSRLNKETQFELYSWKPGIREMVFKLKNKVLATYNAGSDVAYAQTEIEYNFDPIIIDDDSDQPFPQDNVLGKNVIAIGKSDVDVNIPLTKNKSKNTFAVIVANENYQEVANVPNAANDGKVFAEYCRKTLGLMPSNIHLVKDATYNNIKREINWLEQVADAFEGDVKFIFYYAGHGVPDERTRSAYLLPVDGVANDVSTGYSLKELYNVLSQTKAKSVIVLLDACFSGAMRNGDMMMAARGVAIKAKKEKPVGNIVVFSATQNDETAYPYQDKQHGLFTYYLLKKLQESKGDVTLAELTDYVKSNVQQRSIVVNGKPQTPSVISSFAVGDNWERWTMK